MYQQIYLPHRFICVHTMQCVIMQCVVMCLLDKCVPLSQDFVVILNFYY
jgi:hypothetical protein